jgi:hypothetical protein
MVGIIRRSEWRDLCTRVRDCGLRDTMKRCRNITQLNGTWFLDGYAEEDWLYMQLFPRAERVRRSADEIQPYPVGPTAS